MGEFNENVFAEAVAIWEAFFLFNDAFTRGCDDTEYADMESAWA
jgi:hypothetical protein